MVHKLMHPCVEGWGMHVTRGLYKAEYCINQTFILTLWSVIMFVQDHRVCRPQPGDMYAHTVLNCLSLALKPGSLGRNAGLYTSRSMGRVCSIGALFLHRGLGHWHFFAFLQRGETALHMAARAGQVEVVRCLLRNGALVDARARVGVLLVTFLLSLTQKCSRSRGAKEEQFHFYLSTPETGPKPVMYRMCAVGWHQLVSQSLALSPC